MVFTTLFRSRLTRLLAVFFVVLVVSPYTEPFSTMSGDFGSYGSVDVDGAAKFKTSNDGVLATSTTLTIAIVEVTTVEHSHTVSMMRDVRQGERVVLRL